MGTTMEEFVAVKPILDYYIGISPNVVRALLNNREHPYFSLDDPNSKQTTLDQLTSNIIYSRLLSLLKREALLFDKIFILDAKEYGNPSTDILTELEWLIDKNIVTLVNTQDINDYLDAKPGAEDFVKLIGYTRPSRKSLEKKYDQTTRLLDMEFEKIVGGPPMPREKALDKILSIYTKYDETKVKYAYPLAEYATRAHSLMLEYFEKIMAIPLLSYESYLTKIPKSNNTTVAQVVIRDLPLPDGNSPWEKIIEYRENQENQNNLLTLRRWIRKLSAENLSVTECKQELDWLKNEFQAHLKIHRIKANAETLETVIKVPLEILENLLTLKFSKLPDPLFAIKKRQISLMEAELNAPGREIAYLIKSKQEFE